MCTEGCVLTNAVFGLFGLILKSHILCNTVQPSHLHNDYFGQITVKYEYWNVWTNQKPR